MKSILTFLCITPVALLFFPFPLALPIMLAGIAYNERNWWPFAIYIALVIGGVIGMYMDNKIKWMS